MQSGLKNTVSEIATSNWISKADFALELNKDSNSFNQFIKHYSEAGAFGKPEEGTHFVRRGNKNFYSPIYVARVKEFYQSLPSAKRLSQSKRAVMTIPVPVFDPKIADILMSIYKSEAAIQQFLQRKLYEEANPKLRALAELEEEFEKKRLTVLNQTETKLP